jgi:hypothetical protein
MATCNDISPEDARIIESYPEYLFRGTTVGFEGSVYPRLGLTSASADPIVATLFATTASRYGQAVVHLIPVAEFSTRVDDNRQSNAVAACEAEFVIEASPSEIDTASRSITVAVARRILDQMGVTFPANVYNLPDLSAALHQTKRLSPEEIRVFIRAAEELE